jgi:alpha-glucosidase (family GH31 glycosyl hydrolase)
MPQACAAQNTGYGWVGVDVGGFSSDATGELLARWTEFGIFQPFCRNHSARDTRPQKPWAFSEPYLPSWVWVQYWTGEWIAGPAHVLVHAPLEKPAQYVRANTPAPMWPGMMHDQELAPEPLTWLIFAVTEAEEGMGEP